MERSTIVVQTQKEFIHRYLDAPLEVSFLCEYHRHMLHVAVEIEVTHEDRELEFIMVKRLLHRELGSSIKLMWVDKSCETVAKEIAKVLTEAYGDRKMKISVFEDGENGGIYYHNW